MTNGKKVGGLILLIAIPVLILVFLEEFGQQHYTVPTDPAEAEGLSAEVPTGSLGQPFRFSTPPVTDQRKFVSDSLLAGKETIIFPLRDVGSDTTQRVLEALARVQDVFEQAEDVQLLVIATTSEVNQLSQLAQQYRSQPRRWQFLADSASTNSSIASLPPGTSSSTILLVDRDRRIRGYYDGLQEDEIDRLVVETRILRYGVE